ncbi:MAG: AAA family ATPase [Pseudomonadales bacterium]|nr:AAA family ATPase [Pseudomonadales bacterium]
MIDITKRHEGLPACLLNPELYPHPVASLRLVETHISWVILTGSFVYKFKKPLTLDFLDFSSVEKRKYFCEEEIRLNRRFAPELYLGVVPLCCQESGLRLGRGGHIVDYAVKMKQFDSGCLLDQLVVSGAMSLQIAEQIAVKMAGFHASLFARNCEPNAEFGSFQSVSKAVLDNFSTIRPFLSHDELLSLEVLEGWSRNALINLECALTERWQSGMVRECHGDLHLGNMTLINGDVTFFDCIEFNPQFRFIDVVCELAFVLMDLESRGCYAEANHLLNIYLEYRDDYLGLKLLNFYKVYLALVRAKVSLIQERGQGVGKSAVCDNGEPTAFQRYICLAESYLKPRGVFCALTHGVSGSGKTTVGREIAAKAGAIQIRSDVERKRLFGLAPSERSREKLNKTIYTQDISRKTFQRLENLARTILDAGLSVIVDATFLSRRSREPFEILAISLGLPFHILNTVASDSTIRKRLVRREKQALDASEAGLDVMLAQVKVVEDFTRAERDCVVVILSEQPLRGDILTILLENGVDQNN